MIKVGIISELNLHGINYGNRLQAYALNRFISNRYKYETHSLILKGNSGWRLTKFPKIKDVVERILPLIKNNKSRHATNCLPLFNEFTFRKNGVKEEDILNYKDINDLHFNILIIGSDVVWFQNPFSINKSKFLDVNVDNVLKVSYAASFGKDFIPNNNKEYIRKQLSKFKSISVREGSSVDLLNTIGIIDAVHVCDPSLLIKSAEWQDLITKPKLISSNDTYIFLYMLNTDNKILEKELINLNIIAKQKNLKTVILPNMIDNINIIEKYCDIVIDDCSIENWLWLIKNAEYVFTGSFHGVVFSSIFNTKFCATNRITKDDINNRIADYLKTIKQEDKMIDLLYCNKIDSLFWDFNDINKHIEEFRRDSIVFLDDAIGN